MTAVGCDPVTRNPEAFREGKCYFLLPQNPHPLTLGRDWMFQEPNYQDGGRERERKRGGGDVQVSREAGTSVFWNWR